MQDVSQLATSSNSHPSTPHANDHEVSSSNDTPCFLEQYNAFIPPTTESGGLETTAHQPSFSPVFVPQPMEIEEEEGSNMLEILDDAMTQLSQPVSMDEEVVVQAANLPDAARVLYHELRRLLYQTALPNNIPSSASVTNLSMQTLNHRRIRVEM